MEVYGRDESDLIVRHLLPFKRRFASSYNEKQIYHLVTNVFFLPICNGFSYRKQLADDVLINFLPLTFQVQTRLWRHKYISLANVHVGEMNVYGRDETGLTCTINSV